jgi:hypothetical protein
MSYVPKYILKRMLPTDCVKSVGTGIEITFINVLSPITIEQIPDNVLDFLEFKINGKEVANDVKSKIKIAMENEVATIENMRTYIGRTIPVGGKLVINIPLPLEKGIEYDFEITIKTEHPFNIKVQRVVQ